MLKGRLFILFIICLVLASVFYFMSKDTGKQVSKMDKSLAHLSEINPEKIAKITITNDKNAVGITLKEGRWTIDEKWNYPADFNKIYELILNILQIKPVQLITQKEEYFDRFDVNAPDKGGDVKLVAFLDKNNQTLLQLLIGKNRSGKSGTLSGGQYIRFFDDKSVYLISNIIHVSTDPMNWLQKELTDVKGNEISAITIKHKNNKEQIILKRKDKDEAMALDALPAGKKLKEGTLNTITEALSRLSFNDLYPVGSDEVKNLTFETNYRATLFNGLVYNVSMAEKKEKSYIKINVSYEAPSKKEEEDKKEDEQKKDPALRAKEESSRFSGWIYEIPSYRKDNMMKKKSDLLEKK